MKKIVRVDKDIVRVEDYIELTDNLVVKVKNNLSRLYLFKNNNIEVDGRGIGVVGYKENVMIEGGNGLYIGVKNTYILPENFINKDYVIYYRSPKVFKVTCNREISSKDIWNIKEIWGELKNRGNKGK